MLDSVGRSRVCRKDARECLGSSSRPETTSEGKKYEITSALYKQKKTGGREGQRLNSRMNVVPGSSSWDIGVQI